MAKKKLERVDEKVIFVVIFVALFALAIAFIFIKPKGSLTGLVIGPDGQECDGTWVNTSDWSECVDGIQTRTLVNTTSSSCIPPITENQTCTVCGNLIPESGEVCDGTATQQNCTATGGYAGLQNCTASCTWDVCTTLESCGDNIKNGNEECDDGNTADNDGCSAICVEECVPETCESLGYDCGSVDDGCGTSLDCGECEEEDEEETTPEETTEIITSEVIEENVPNVPSCTADWQCTEWSECSADGVQTRTCTDANACGVEEGKPAESQACTPAETCFDGIKNQNEKGIDCGGSCEKKCSIFTILGSAINIPLNASRQFFVENKTRSYIILGAAVLLIGGIIAWFSFFKKKFFNLVKNKKKNFSAKDEEGSDSDF